jgi:hypothetical protein
MSMRISVHLPLIMACMYDWIKVHSSFKARAISVQGVGLDFNDGLKTGHFIMHLSCPVRVSSVYMTTKTSIIHGNRTAMRSSVDANTTKRHSKVKDAIFDTFRSFQWSVNGIKQERGADVDKENCASTSMTRTDRHHGRSRSFLPMSMTSKAQALRERATQDENRGLRGTPSLTASQTLETVSNMVCNAADREYVHFGRPLFQHRNLSIEVEKRPEVNRLALQSLYSQVILPSCVSSSRPRSTAGSAARGGSEDIAEAKVNAYPSAASASLLPPQRSQRRRSVQVVKPAEAEALTRSSTETNIGQFASMHSKRTGSYGASSFGIAPRSRSPLQNLSNPPQIQQSLQDVAMSGDFDEGAKDSNDGSHTTSSGNQVTLIRNLSKRKPVDYIGLSANSSRSAVDSSPSALVDLTEDFASSSISSRKRHSHGQSPPPYTESFLMIE